MNKEKRKVFDEMFSLWMEIAKSDKPNTKPERAKIWHNSCPACEENFLDGGCWSLTCLMNPIWGSQRAYEYLEELEKGEEGCYFCVESKTSPYRKWDSERATEREKRYYALKIAWGAYQLGHDPNDWRSPYDEGPLSL